MVNGNEQPLIKWSHGEGEEFVLVFRRLCGESSSLVVEFTFGPLQLSSYELSEKERKA